MLGEDDGEDISTSKSNGRPVNSGEEHYASVEHLMGMLAAFQVHSFVDIYVTQDERNSSQYILQVR